MNKALRNSVRKGGNTAAKPLDWRRKMSDHIAYALLVYTGLQIYVTMAALKVGGGSILPYFALIVLVAGIIPACRIVERRWDRLNDAQAAEPALIGYFRRDCAILWLLAIVLPFVVAGLVKLAHLIF